MEGDSTGRDWDRQLRKLEKARAYDQVLAECRRRVQSNPNNAVAWSSAGWALIALKRYDEALDSLERSLGLDPGRWAVWQNKGIALKRLNRPKEALGALDQALALGGPHWKTLDEKGDVLRILGDYDQALAVTEEAQTQSAERESVGGQGDDPVGYAPLSRCAAGSRPCLDP